MGLIELILLAAGLSMDAFAVSICKGLETKEVTLRECLLCGVWFGGFQGLMPFIGYLLGASFEDIINKIAPWLAFILLVLIGLNMLREAVFDKKEEIPQNISWEGNPIGEVVSGNKNNQPKKNGFGIKIMFLMSVATSIDALAVGITFAAVPVNVFETSSFINTVFACVLIMVTTFLFSSVGVRVGNIFGAKYSSRAQAAGGIVLILIGLKILLEHFGVITF